MEIIPAIDLKGGRCVRLYQGDYAQETVYSDDPVEVALHWQSLGASRLHLIDLDGAAKGEIQHFNLLRDIAEAIQIPLQVGGGVRTIEMIERLLELGIARVILGTMAARNPKLAEEISHRFGEATIIGVDAREGFVVVEGWQEKTSLSTVDFVRQVTTLGAKRIIYTDVSRDGTLTEPNFTAIAELLSNTTLPVIASGGISSIEHLRRLSSLGVEGAIVGRALYTGDIRLEEALSSINIT